MRRFTRACVVALVCLPATLRAEMVILTNGDRIQGAPAGRDGDVLIWRSPLLGDLRLPTSVVKEIRADSATNVVALTPRQPDTSGDEPGQEAVEAAKSSGGPVSAAISTLADHSARTNPFPKRLTLTDITIDIAGKASSGNDDQTTLAVDFNSVFRHRRHRHYVTVEYDKEWEDEITTTDENLFRYKYNYFIEGPFLGYAWLERNENELSDVRERLTASAGPGYEVFDTDQLRWAFETGPAFNREDFETDVDREFWGWHYGMDWRWLITCLGLEFFHNHSVMESFETSTDWEIETDTGTRLNVVDRLKVVLKLEYDYDNLPARDKDKEDSTLTLGFSYGW